VTRLEKGQQPGKSKKKSKEREKKDEKERKEKEWDGCPNVNEDMKRKR